MINPKSQRSIIVLYCILFLFSPNIILMIVDSSVCNIFWTHMGYFLKSLKQYSTNNSTQNWLFIFCIIKSQINITGKSLGRYKFFQWVKSVKTKEYSKLLLKGLIIVYFCHKSRPIIIYFSAHIYYTHFLYFNVMQFNMDIHLSLCVIFMNLRILLQRLTVFSYKTSHFQYIYKKDNIRIFNSLNNCLQDVLELTPTIDLITLFCTLNILSFNSPPIPPPTRIVSQTIGVPEI